MYRIIMALAAAGAVAACDTGGNPTKSEEFTGVGEGAQPLIDEPVPETGADDGEDTVVATGPDVYGTEINADLTMNDVDFDPATGELVLNNMPFDGEDNLYKRDGAVSDRLAAAGFSTDVYANVGGQNAYFAVFRLSASGNSQIAAVGNDAYVSFGFGGVAAQRLEGNGALPVANEEYVFSGEYAAVRTIIDPDTSERIQYVAGTATIAVDIEDFDDVGAVEGVIADRRFFDANGIQINALDNADFISLATAQINFDDWTIQSSAATAFVGPGAEAGASGTWEGLFAGPNGEEVAGIVFIEGNSPVGIDVATGEYIQVSVRESGGFIATR